MVRALISLIAGIASTIIAFVPLGPLVSIALGIVAVGAGGPLKSDTRAKIGMLFGLAGIVLAFVMLALSLPPVES